MPSRRRGFVRKAIDALAYGALKIGLVSVPLLSPAMALSIARWCGATLYLLCRRRRGIALRNLDIAFRSGFSWAQKKRIARRAFQHAHATFVSMAGRHRWARKENVKELFQYDSATIALLCEPHPHGVCLLSGHLGDWELLQHFLALVGISTVAVTREASNPYVGAEIRRIRSSTGARLIPKEGALRELLSSLRRGEVVGILPDQNCPKREHFFDFFGVPASTYTEYARILERSGCRVLFLACVRQDFRFRFRIIAKELPPGLEADELVRRYLSTLEDAIREYPDQYLWLHRRWKSRPTGTPWFYHDLGRPLDASLLER